MDVDESLTVLTSPDRSVRTLAPARAFRSRRHYVLKPDFTNPTAPPLAGTAADAEWFPRCAQRELEPEPSHGLQLASLKPDPMNRRLYCLPDAAEVWSA